MNTDPAFAATHGVFEDRRSLNALLVEDDDIDAQIVETLIRASHQIDVCFTRAKSVKEAKLCIENHKFDVYFVDLVLGDGLALKLLATLESAGARPIVLSNINRSEADKLRLTSGATRFMPKAECHQNAIISILQDALRPSP